jgi:hypothetical protein
MRRLFEITPAGQQALHSSDWVPTQFLVDGDKKEGYTLHFVDDQLCGWNLVKNDGHIKSLYAVKAVIDEINQKGVPTDYTKVLDMRCFGWANIPIKEILPIKDILLPEPKRTEEAASGRVFLRVSQLIMNHLSDVQHEILSELVSRATHRCNFVKWLIQRYPDTNQEVDYAEVYKTFITAHPQWKI